MHIRKAARVSREQSRGDRHDLIAHCAERRDYNGKGAPSKARKIVYSRNALYGTRSALVYLTLVGYGHNGVTAQRRAFAVVYIMLVHSLFYSKGFESLFVLAVKLYGDILGLVIVKTENTVGSLFVIDVFVVVDVRVNGKQKPIVDPRPFPYGLTENLTIKNMTCASGKPVFICNNPDAFKTTSIEVNGEKLN